MSELLKNKSVIITGASRGIGAASGEAFAALGAHVVLVARDADALTALESSIKADGGSAIAVAGDISDYAVMEAVVRRCVDEFGSVDVLVNNAGVIEPIARLADSDPAEWTKAIDVNVKGVYYGIRACLPTMLEAGGGTIVNVSSGAATSAMEGWSHYCSSKAAVLSVTQCVHKEYGEQGIRMLGMSPGTVATGMQVAIKASGLNPVSQLDPSVHIPAEWAAKAILWLCTPESDEFKGTDFSLRAPGSYERVGIA